jgi:hypothetical protein
MKILIVLLFIALGFLLFAIGIFGMVGMWTKIVFIDLTPLQDSWKSVLWLFGLGAVSEFVAGVIMKTK